MSYKVIPIVSLSLGFINFLKRLKTEVFSNNVFIFRKCLFSHVYYCWMMVIKKVDYMFPVYP